MHINYITNQTTFDEALKDLTAAPKICLDFETTGLQAGIAKPRLLQICSADLTISDRKIHIFDFFKLEDTSKLKSLIESREMVIGHNLNFDFQFLLLLNIDFNNKVFDTYIAERILRSGFKEKRISPQAKTVYFADVSCALQAVIQRRFEKEISKEQRLTDWSSDTLTEDQLTYAATDVDILPQLAADQLKELREENLLQIYSIESQCIRPVARMCFRGFGIDLEKLKILKQDITTELENKTNEFVSQLDNRLPPDKKLPRDEEDNLLIGKKPKKQFNPGSPTQVVAAFTACKIDLPKDTNTEKPTLNQVALSEFASSDRTLRVYRERAKVETRLEHVNKLLVNVNPLTQRIHSGYNQVGANSGRFTSRGAPKTSKTKQKTVFSVNIQQIPKKKYFRECFTSSPGYKLVICDWSQIELRLGAELINIPQMKQAFINGIDLHTMTASLIHRKELTQVSKEERQDGKTLNFALLYGMGFRKYKTYAAQSGKVLTLSEARIAHAAFHNAYPRLRLWHQERASLVNDGWAYIRTACGRRRLLSYDDATMMCSANTLIQGSGADILKIAISKLNPYLNDEVHLVACIHDELVLEVKEHLASQFKTILESVMISAAEVVLKTVPAAADANIGESWAAK